MRRRRTTSAVHADRMIPKLLKNMPGINAVFFLFNIFLISAALTVGRRIESGGSGELFTA
jgi:hypothetical protein